MPGLFYIFALLAVLAAIGVLVFRQPLYSAFCLVANMVILAALFAGLDAHFLAATQLIVYAGAIMVLVVFVIMLLSLEVEEQMPSVAGVLISSLIGVGFLALLIPALQGQFGSSIAIESIQGSVKAIGSLLFTKYVFPFEASSILLMVALVGAVALAKDTGVKDTGGKGTAAKSKGLKEGGS